MGICALSISAYLRLKFAPADPPLLSAMAAQNAAIAAAAMAAVQVCSGLCNLVKPAICCSENGLADVALLLASAADSVAFALQSMYYFTGTHCVFGVFGNCRSYCWPFHTSMIHSCNNVPYLCACLALGSHR